MIDQRWRWGLIMFLSLMMIGTAQADNKVGVASALGLMARAVAADDKCHYLSEKKRAELDSYAQKAEKAAMQRGVDSGVKKIVEIGRTQGKISRCDAASGQDVEETLQAAREAVSALATNPSHNVSEPPSPSTTVAPLSVKMTAEAKSHTPPAVMAITQLKKQSQNKHVSSYDSITNLEKYRRAALGYYVERRCQTMNFAEATNFYSRLMVMHRKFVKKYGGRAIGSLVMQTQSRAQSISCNQAAATMVSTGYSMTRVQ